MNKTKSNWLFLSQVAIQNPDAEVLEEYKGGKTKVKVKCKLCGEIYYDYPQNILLGKLHRKKGNSFNGCKWCRHWYYDKRKQKVILNQLNDVYKKYPNFEFLEPYNPITKQIKCRCLQCNDIFFETLDNLYKENYWCKKCHHIDNGKQLHLGGTMRAKKLNSIFKSSPNIEFILKDNSNIHCKCTKCEKIFVIKGYMNRRKITCPFCYQENLKEKRNNKKFEKNNTDYTSIKRKCDYMPYCLSTKNFLCDNCAIRLEPYYKKNEFKSIAEAVNTHIEILEEYVDSNTKIKYRCKKCGNVYSAKPSSILCGKCGCSYCKQSKGELIISTYLDDHNIIYEQEKVFDDCKNIRALRFDFYIEKLNVVIEYDGKQHFEPTSFYGVCDFKGIQKRDAIKEEYCKKKKIKLIRIPYYCKDICAELDTKLSIK